MEKSWKFKGMGSTVKPCGAENPGGGGQTANKTSVGCMNIFLNRTLSV